MCNKKDRIIYFFLVFKTNIKRISKVSGNIHKDEIKSNTNS